MNWVNEAIKPFAWEGVYEAPGDVLRSRLVSPRGRPRANAARQRTGGVMVNRALMCAWTV